MLGNPPPAWLGSNGQLAEVECTEETQHLQEDTKPRTSSFTAEFALEIRIKTSKGGLLVLQITLMCTMMETKKTKRCD